MGFDVIDRIFGGGIFFCFLILGLGELGWDSIGKVWARDEEVGRLESWVSVRWMGDGKEMGNKGTKS